MGLKFRNLETSLQQRIDENAGTFNGYGVHYYVDPNTTRTNPPYTSGGGKSWDEPLTSLTNAFTNMLLGDTVWLAPGNHTGNHSTPVNATAPFINIIGVHTHPYGLAAWAGATAAGSPVLTVRSRGVRIEGIEFDPGATGPGIQLLKSADGSTHRPDFCTVHNCLFTGGESGIDFSGGATFPHFAHNHFTAITGTSDTQGGIVCSSSSFQLPQFGVFEDLVFTEVAQQIAFSSNGLRGPRSSIFRRNIHPNDGVDRDASIMLDIRNGGAGGNQIVECFFGTTRADLANDASTLILTNTDDEAMGCWAADGRIADASDIAH
jgi:hypothetical protein